MGHIDRKSNRASTVLRWSIAVGLLIVGAGPSFSRPLPEVQSVAIDEVSTQAHTVQEDSVSLQQAIERAQRRYPGRVLRAETKVQNGRRVHEIRILGDDGRVRTVRFNADGSG